MAAGQAASFPSHCFRKATTDKVYSHGCMLFKRGLAANCSQELCKQQACPRLFKMVRQGSGTLESRPLPGCPGPPASSGGNSCPWGGHCLGCTKSAPEGRPAPRRWCRYQSGRTAHEGRPCQGSKAVPHADLPCAGRAGNGQGGALQAGSPGVRPCTCDITSPVRRPAQQCGQLSHHLLWLPGHKHPGPSGGQHHVHHL